MTIDVEAIVQQAVVPWGCWSSESDLTLTFPANFSVRVNAIQDAPACTPAALKSALSSPIGTKPLRDLAAGARTAVIAVEDITRPTPLSAILSLMLDELETSIDADNIKILVALGAHRPMVRSELEQKIGAAVLDRFDVEQHHPYENLMHFGQSSRGTPIWLNQTFCRADLKVGLGSVMPHPYMGFGGGAKLVVPGLAGIETLQANHQPAVTGISGGLGNPDVDARREVEEIAVGAGLAFVSNAVVNSRREIAGVFAGDVVGAHRAATRFARTTYTTACAGAPYDVVVLNAYPKDGELLQVGNAFNCYRTSSRPLLKEEGTLIVTASCHFGRGHHSLHGRGMRLYAPPAAKRYLGGREVLFFSPHLNERDARVSFAPEYRFFRAWDDLTSYIAAKHRGPASVAVFPTAPLQILD